MTVLSLGGTGLRGRYGVTVVSIKRPGEDFAYATADTTVYADDVLIVAGRVAPLEARSLSSTPSTLVQVGELTEDH
jgi:trk system potassium uptake protein TrkA